MKKPIILITGSSSGIGFSSMKLFLERGWNIIAHYYEENKDFDNLCNEQSERCKKIKADFGSVAELENFIYEIDKYTEITALLNCAGCFDFSKKTENRIEDAKKIFQINSIAPTLIAEKVLNIMKNNKSGSIINVSSIGVKFGSNLENVFYSESKSAIEALTRSLAREGAPCNVLVNTIRPGIVDTKFYEKIGKDITERVKLIPMKRAANADEISELIYYLCSENSYITSQIIPISGGE